MNPDHQTGARTDANFPETHLSLVCRAGERSNPGADSALEKICTLYWAPLYAFLRRRGETPADAQDHVQGFFARLVEKEFLQQLDAERGRFRTFLRSALWHYVLNERRAERAERRGGGAPVLSLEAAMEAGAAGVEPKVEATPDEAYDTQWARDVMERALRRLQQECADARRDGRFADLAPWLSAQAAPGEYAALASSRGVSENAIAQEVRRLRARLLELVRAEVMATITEPPMIEDELRYVLAILVRPDSPRG